MKSKMPSTKSRGRVTTPRLAGYDISRPSETVVSELDPHFMEKLPVQDQKPKNRKNLQAGHPQSDVEISWKKPKDRSDIYKMHKSTISKDAPSSITGNRTYGTAMRSEIPVN